MIRCNDDQLLDIIALVHRLHTDQILIHFKTNGNTGSDIIKTYRYNDQLLGWINQSNMFRFHDKRTYLWEIFSKDGQRFDRGY